ncbi:unnamed protein product [Mycena citricolor]|uniref:Uncharacterized protein n=1 Tax=Mycena citricolor TaxID=2018698 RepID=A0AAD2H443_9AGAR|nr:unnamed protein product [Mycena citricolor]CAK5269624.1 unnamed protein product [Mycena citricolor]
MTEARSFWIVPSFKQRSCSECRRPDEPRNSADAKRRSIALRDIGSLVDWTIRTETTSEISFTSLLPVIICCIKYTAPIAS